MQIEYLCNYLEIYKKKPVKLIMPKMGEIAYFKNYRKENEHTYVIYIDFESALYKIDTSKPHPTKSFTVKTLLHKLYVI